MKGKTKILILIISCLTLKISYSWMESMKAISNKRNSRVLNEEKPINSKTFNRFNKNKFTIKQNLFTSGNCVKWMDYMQSTTASRQSFFCFLKTYFKLYANHLK